MQLLIIILAIAGCSIQVDSNKEEINLFVKDVANKDIPFEEIKNEYLYLREIPEDRKLARDSIIVEMLGLFRKNFSTEDVSEYQVLNYNEAKIQNLTSKLNTIDLDANDIYFVISGSGETRLKILMKDNKIWAFFTLGKGENSIFDFVRL